MNAPAVGNKIISPVERKTRYPRRSTTVTVDAKLNTATGEHELPSAALRLSLSRTSEALRELVHQFADADTATLGFIDEKLLCCWKRATGEDHAALVVGLLRASRPALLFRFRHY